MPYEEPEMLKMLHEIREKQYEETRDLTVQERLDKIRENADAFKKKYGLKLRKSEIVRK